MGYYIVRIWLYIPLLAKEYTPCLGVKEIIMKDTMKALADAMRAQIKNMDEQLMSCLQHGSYRAASQLLIELTAMKAQLRAIGGLND